MPDAIANPLPHGATARRITWDELPGAVRAGVEERLGSRVVRAASQGSGFTSGLASRLLLADGSRAFLKAVAAAADPFVHAGYRQEVAVARALPEQVPAPRLRWHADLHEDGGNGGDWLVLAFEDVGGRPPRRPWDAAELQAVLAVLEPTARALTPPPAGMPALPTLRSEVADFRHWRAVAGGESDGARHPRLSELADLEADWLDLASGDTAVHFDLRDDNVILADDGRVLVCDWNWLTLGAPWLDLVGLLIGAHGDGLDADARLAAHPLARGVPARAVDSYLAALGGFFTASAARAAVPGSPWLRPHQAWYRDATLSWLGHRRGW